MYPSSCVDSFRFSGYPQRRFLSAIVDTDNVNRVDPTGYWRLVNGSHGLQYARGITNDEAKTARPK